MIKREIKERIRSMEDLPTLPSVALKIMNTLLNEDPSIKDIAEVVETDHALTMKVLKVANSAFYGTPRSASTVKDAIASLGFGKLKSIVLSLSVMDTIETIAEESGLDAEEFWAHSLTCAVCAEELAEKLDRKFSEEVFVAGLLHDIGKLLLSRHAPSEFKRALEMARTQGIGGAEAERAILDVDHALVGKWVMDHWQFPIPLRESVWLHHNPPIEYMENDISCRMAAVICLADILTHTRTAGPIRNRGLAQGEEIQEKLGLSKEQVQEVVDALDDRVAQIIEALGREPVPQEGYFEILQQANAELGRTSLLLDHQREELRRKEAEKTMLYRLGSRLLRCSQPNEILEALGQEIVKSIGCQRITAHLQLEEGRTLVAEAYPAKDGRVLRKSRTVPAEECSSNAPEDLVEGGRTEIVVGGRSVGSISAWRSAEETASEGENEILGVVANLAALAIERTQIHLQSQDRAEMLATAHAELKRTHDDLREAQQRMVHLEALACLGEMVAVVAHDIRSPLAGIMGFASFLTRDLEHDPNSRKMVGKIISEVERLDLMITDLLVLAKPLKPEPQKMDIQLPVNSALSLIEAEMNGNRHAVHIETVFPKEPAELEADPRMLQEAFLNLFKNAIQAMPNGGELRVEAHLESISTMARNGDTPKAQQLRIRISDTGTGMTPEVKKKLFQPFVTTKEKGMGLGLTMVERIVEVHRGRIDVDSQPGRGTTFSIALPVSANGAPSAKNEEPSS